MLRGLATATLVMAVISPATAQDLEIACTGTAIETSYNGAAFRNRAKTEERPMTVTLRTDGRSYIEERNAGGTVRTTFSVSDGVLRFCSTGNGIPCDVVQESRLPGDSPDAAPGYRRYTSSRLVLSNGAFRRSLGWAYLEGDNVALFTEIQLQCEPDKVASLARMILGGSN